MKNASLALNVILAIAVAVLYVLHFTSGGKSTNAAADNSVPTNLKVVYINEDTVLKYYDFFKVKRDALEAKAKGFDDQLTARQTSLQREVQAYRATAASLTIGQAQTIEQNLQEKGQNLQMYQQSLGQQMADEQAKVADELYDKVHKFLTEYGRQNGYQVILKYNRGSDILFGGDSLDVTKDVIKGLNESWKAESSKTPAAKDTTKKGK